jgi:hypothetical protein
MIANAVRYLLYVVVFGMGCMAVGVTGLGLMYDETPLCEPGGFVALSGCQKGDKAVPRYIATLVR